MINFLYGDKRGKLFYDWWFFRWFLRELFELKGLLKLMEGL